MKDKWDLTKLVKNRKEYESGIERIKALAKEIEDMKGHILDDENTLLKYVKTDEELSLLQERLYVYALIKYYDDMGNTENQADKEAMSKLLSDVSSSLSFVTPELFKHDLNYVKGLINKKEELKKYEFSFEETYRYQEHFLSDAEEKIMSSLSETFSTSRNAFNALDNVDISLGNIIDESGNEVELTQSNYQRYIQSKNREVRKSAFEKLYAYFKGRINTISALYAGVVKQDAFVTQTRKYDSILQRALFGDMVSPEAYKTLIKVVDKHLELIKRYYRLKGKCLGIDEMHMYDTGVNISESKNKEIPYEEGKKIILDALSILGEDYIKNISHLFDSNCVDVYPKKNKKSGAYEIATYGVDPYVSTNYEGTIDSVSTVAHEMGHAMHSYYSNKNNPFIYAEYPIILAEIASTVNETILSDYLLKHTDDEEEKIYYLVEFLDGFKGTIYRQTMFAEFEYLIHDMYERGESLTTEVICNTYKDLVKKHFEDAVYVDDEISYEWARIPHFYTPFYVYKYATGLISALCIVDKLKKEEGFNEKYIKDFLSRGGSDYPLNILKGIGIDITDESTLDSAFDMFEDKLNELESLVMKRRK